MLLFNKKDMQIICKYDGETVTFSKTLKEILKYQYKYNYRFKAYVTAEDFTGYFIADDYLISGDELTVFFGGFSISYNSDGATFTPSSGGEGGEGGLQLYGPYYATTRQTVVVAPNTGKIIELEDVWGSHSAIDHTWFSNSSMVIACKTAVQMGDGIMLGNVFANNGLKISVTNMSDVNTVITPEVYIYSTWDMEA